MDRNARGGALSRGGARSRGAALLAAALLVGALCIGCGPADLPSGTTPTHPGVGATCAAHSDCEAAGAPPPCQLWGCSQGACVLLAMQDGTVCQQGDACHPGTCKLGVCQAQATSCDAPKDPCFDAACDPSDGQCRPVPSASGTPCDDGRACSLKDICRFGVCAGDASACPCEHDVDCPDDGDRCNGLSYCDLSSGTCATNPATVVKCPTSKDTACAKLTCDPPSGLCLPKPTAAGTPCDDGEACTVGDVCQGGVCKAGTFTCDCEADADCQDDGDACNGTPFCNKALNKCVVNPATSVTCKTVGDTACLANTCQPATGACKMQPVGEGKPCDDNDVCTVDETCTAGVCGTKTSLCECTSDADCAAKEDGDVCNGTLFCDKAVKACKLAPNTVVTCQSVDDTPCRANVCQPKTGACVMVTQPAGTPCDDGVPCTIGEVCKGAVCGTGVAAAQCACAADADCAKFSDGNACTGQLRCDKTTSPAVCAPTPGSGVSCPSDGNPCTVASCDPKTGKCVSKALADGSVCGAAQGCIAASTCKAGACVPGGQSDCDDQDPCTTDACVDGSCANTPVAAGTKVPCYDGPPGTEGVGVCAPGTTTCDAQGKPGACSGATKPAASDPCGGGNEDCDAATDEDCALGYTVTKLCGTGQAGPPGQTLSQRLLVQVKTDKGAPAAGTTVSWTAPNGGSFDTPTSQTDASGHASAIFTLPANAGTSAIARAAAGGGSADFSFSVKAGAPAAVLHYPSFCDTAQLKLHGKATVVSKALRIVTKGDLNNGSVWFTKPVPAGSSFEARFTIEGYTPGYSLVLQGVGGVNQKAGGKADAGTTKLNPALVMQVTGTYGAGSAQPATARLYGNGQTLGTKSNALAKNKTLQKNTFWLSYDAASTKVVVRLAAGDASTKGPVIIQATWDVWAAMGAKPAFIGFTAGNSTAGMTGNKIVSKWAVWTL